MVVMVVTDYAGIATSKCAVEKGYALAITSKPMRCQVKWHVGFVQMLTITS